MNVERQQITTTTDAQLRDRRLALKERYDPKNDGGGYPMPQLRELHLIEEELAARAAERRDDREDERPHPDNHSALFASTDIEWSLKYGR